MDEKLLTKVQAKKNVVVRWNPASCRQCFSKQIPKCSCKKRGDLYQIERVTEESFSSQPLKQDQIWVQVKGDKQYYTNDSQAFF